MIELLCLDIDGTLLNSDKELVKENIEAVEYAMKKGVKVFIASGRSVAGLQELFHELKIRENAICLNGGLLVCEGKIIYEDVMPMQMIEKIISLVEKYQSKVFLSTAELNITNGMLSKKLQESVTKGSLKSAFIYCDNYEQIRQEAKKFQKNIIKACINDMDEKNYEQLKKELIQLDLFSVAKSDTHFLDINMRGTSKEKGMRVLASHLDIGMEHVMCIGDNENDKEMVSAAGVGVAMENAVLQVKEVANYITASNDAHGVADAIYHFI